MGRLSQRTPGRQKVGVGLTRGSLCAHAVCADAPASGSPYTPPPCWEGGGGSQRRCGLKARTFGKKSARERRFQPTTGRGGTVGGGVRYQSFHAWRTGGGGNGARSLCLSGVERGGDGGGGRSLGMHAGKADGEGAPITQSAHTILARTLGGRQGAHTRGVSATKTTRLDCLGSDAGGRGGAARCKGMRMRLHRCGRVHRWARCGSLGGPCGPGAGALGTGRGKCSLPDRPNEHVLPPYCHAPLDGGIVPSRSATHSHSSAGWPSPRATLSPCARRTVSLFCTAPATEAIGNGVPRGRRGSYMRGLRSRSLPFLPSVCQCCGPP